MLNISICGESTLSINAINRLLQDEPLFKHHTIQAFVESDETRKNISSKLSGLKKDILVYCAAAYSNTLLKTIKQLHQKSPDVQKVLIINMAHKHFLKKLIQAGIVSIVSYQSSLAELTQAINYAALNQQFLSTDLCSMVLKSKYQSSLNRLSQRELEITYMITNGMNVKSVSNELDISPKTVNTYRYRIFNKLEINRNIELFRMVSREAAYMLSK